MHRCENQLWINDYLDLYLYAKKLDDYLWQEEIVEKLKTYYNSVIWRNPVNSKSS